MLTQSRRCRTEFTSRRQELPPSLMSFMSRALRVLRRRRRPPMSRVPTSGHNPPVAERCHLPPGIGGRAHAPEFVHVLPSVGHVCHVERTRPAALAACVAHGTPRVKTVGSIEVPGPQGPHKRIGKRAVGYGPGAVVDRSPRRQRIAAGWPLSIGW